MISAKIYPDLPPRQKPLQKAVIAAAMFVVGRAFQSLSHSEPLIRHEVSGWPKGLTLMMKLQPNGSSVALQKQPDGTVKYMGAHFDENKADVVIYFKTIEAAFKMFTAQTGIDVAYAQHCMCARGDLSNTVSVVRALGITECYLFPSIISKHLVKRLPAIPFWRKQGLRLKTYLLGIPFGI
ncbi:MAG TPA: hypothetical protein PLA25_01265 [Anaerolineaceae bacterium]|nr:hypothetical protein [Anaerolineaceae bacterium]HNZ12365.1 hypothetical protein [Anaerolineaceae bacterium]HQF63675.1 hypothetical protein [Anaerolineaceae bacterium]HQH86729.1 hypothetical protein [Anaerolineaceae bacterium]HQN42733.1 hypothetical protein [Anaerolineaceae bacterium]